MSASWFTDSGLTDLGIMELARTDLGLSILALLGGLAVGWAFYDGLRRTVCALPDTEHPVRLLAFSLALRFSLVAAFGWLLLTAGGGWPQILIALAAMIVMRWLIMRSTLRTRRSRAAAMERTVPQASVDANSSKGPPS